MSRRNQAQKLPDEDTQPGHSGHFTSVTGGKILTDSDSVEEDDQKHILKTHARSEDIESNGSNGGTGGNSWITKTVEYEIQQDTKFVR